MIKSRKIYLIVIVVFITIIWACKSKPQELFNALIIEPNAAFINTGDSIQFFITNKNNQTEIKLSPNIGHVNAANWYVAPSSIVDDSLQVLLTVSNQQEEITARVYLIKSSINDTLISFNKTILPLMVSNCNFSACHGNGSRAGKVELSTYDSVMKFVVPHQPNQSLLYTCLIKPDVLRRMPPAGPLHGYRINYIKKWIEQGAIAN